MAWLGDPCRTRMMPWSLERTDATLLVSITAPVDDWDAVLMAVDEALADTPPTVTLPTGLPGGSKTDREMLTSLWRAVGASGTQTVPL
jgi:hypothetical protein